MFITMIRIILGGITECFAVSGSSAKMEETWKIIYKDTKSFTPEQSSMKFVDINSSYGMNTIL